MRISIRTAGIVGLATFSISACSSETLESSEPDAPTPFDESASHQEEQGDESETVSVVVEQLAERRAISYEEARERLSWQERLPALNALSTDSLGEGFAGVWVDVNDGDRVKISVDSTRIQDLGRLQHVLDASGIAEAIDVVEARYSMVELDAAVEALGDRMVQQEKPSPGLSVGVRTDLNAIQLGVPSEGMTPESQALVDAALEEYGDMVVIEVTGTPPEPDSGSCSGNGCTTVLHAGQRIVSDEGCTAGFLAASGSRRFVFTAGHCIVNGGTAQGKNAAGNMADIGPDYRAIYGTNNLRTSHTNRDIGIIELTSGNWTADNMVLRYSGPGYTYSHSHQINYEGTSTVGSEICMSGATSQATQCGDILAVNVTFTDVNGMLIRKAGKANYCRMPGDSGAPLFNTSTALGIHTHGQNCVAYYQGITEAESLMQVGVLH